MSAFSDPQRWSLAVLLLVLLVSAVGAGVVVWRERRWPSVPAHVAALRAWRRLPVVGQAAVDAAALEAAAAAEVAREHAVEAALVAWERDFGSGDPLRP